MSKRGFSKTKGDTRASGKEPRNPTAPTGSTAPRPVLPVDDSELLGPSVLIPLYILLIVLGYVLLHRGVGATHGNEFSQPQSIFTAVNAATLTGFQQSRNVNDYTLGGQLLMLLLMVAGIVFSFTAGGLAVVRIARLNYSQWRVFAWAWGATAVVIFAGGCLVFLFSPKMKPFDAIFQAISAFGNCGLYTGVLPNRGAGVMNVVLIPLAVIGGLGLPVLMEIFDRWRGKPPIPTGLSTYSQSILRWTALCYVAAVVILFLLDLPGWNASALQWRRAVVAASVEAINTRSLGFPFTFPTNTLVQWAMILLMLIGASPAGTAGGIRVTTLALVQQGIGDSLHGLLPGRAFAKALLWLSIYLAMLAMAQLALLYSDPEISPDRLLFLAASALGNVGLSHNPVSVTDSGLYVLTITMLAGRIAPVLMIWWMLEA